MVPAAMKRKERDDTDRSATVESKRLKVESTDELREEENAENPEGKNVGATELASAFALASLAGFNSAVPKTADVPETREAEHGEEGSTTSFEAFSPRTEPVPISPEVNSPLRTANNKRVSFAPGIKDATRLGSRSSSFPPRVFQGQGSRMPPGFARLPGPLRPPMPPPSRMEMEHHWLRKHHGQPGGFMPPQQVPAPQQQDQWVCDYCNVAAFPTYQEACAHEGACRARFMDRLNGGYPGVWGGPRQGPRLVPPPPQFTPHGMGPPRALLPRGYPPNNMPQYHHGIRPSVSMEYVDNMASSQNTFFSGSLSLSIPESDPDWLSGLNCYIRQYCVEAFSVTGEDAEQMLKLGPSTYQQVGIRCCFCRLRPMDERQAAAVSFPMALSGIYESVKRWQRVHLQLCEDVPDPVMAKLHALNTENSWIPTTRQYWADSARSLGMVDTSEGIRFSVDPSFRSRPPPGPIQCVEVIAPPRATSPRNKYPPNEMHEPMGSMEEGESIVTPEDTNMVPPYVYFLIRQVESCRFTETDRFVARSKGPVGYPGFQCRHCHGHAGLGKYFPVSSKSLATNSTSQNIHAHLLKCRKCPTHIKEQLLSLKEEKSKAPRLEPGWRKVFFEKIWSRLHE